MTAPPPTRYHTENNTLILQDVLPGDQSGPPMHIHRTTAETFRVHSGLLSLRLPGQTITVAPGADYTVPAGLPHSFHTKGSVDVHCTILLAPAGQMEVFFRGLGHVTQHGRSPLLQIAVMHQACPQMDFYTAGPPIWAQRVLYAALAPLAKLLGYRATYP